MATVADVNPPVDGPAAEPEPSLEPSPEPKHMPGNTVYLVTGASSGIGAALLPILLSRPLTTVIAFHRPSAPFPPSLPPFTPHPTATLIPQHYTATQPASTIHWIASSLRNDYGIRRIDIVIASAGIAESLQPVLQTTWEDVAGHVDVNMGGTLRLVQGLRGLLGLEEMPGHAFPPALSAERAQGGWKGSTFVLVSSSVASLGSPEPKEAPGLAYGASKAAANFLTVRLHQELGGAPTHLCACAVHPGWVRTRMGRAAARAWGAPEDTPPLSAAASAAKVLAVVERATVEGQGGRFWGCEGEEMVW